MLDPTIIEELIANHTARGLRSMLRLFDFTEYERAHFIAAIYYMEGAEDNA